MTIFANPAIPDKPEVGGAGVVTVAPGELAPQDGNWTTLYFLPGLHDVGLSFRLHRDRSYYIPGEAVVYGTMNNDQEWSDGRGSTGTALCLETGCLILVMPIRL